MQLAWILWKFLCSWWRTGMVYLQTEMMKLALFWLKSKMAVSKERVLYDRCVERQEPEGKRKITEIPAGIDLMLDVLINDNRRRVDNLHRGYLYDPCRHPCVSQHWWLHMENIESYVMNCEIYQTQLSNSIRLNKSILKKHSNWSCFFIMFLESHSRNIRETAVLRFKVRTSHPLGVTVSNWRNQSPSREGNVWPHKRENLT